MRTFYNFALLLALSGVASATSFTFVSNVAVTEPTAGDLNLGAASDAGTLDFNAPSINAINGTTTANLVNPGDLSAFFLLGSLTLNEGNTSIDAGEMDNLNIRFAFSLNIGAFGFTVANLTNPGVSNAASWSWVTGTTTDGGTDVSVNFSALTSDVSFGTTGLLRARIYDDAAAGDQILDFNEDTAENFYVQFELVNADVALAPVPEPSSLGLMGGGLLALGALARKFKK
jgi:hypothetical protein